MSKPMKSAMSQNGSRRCGVVVAALLLGVSSFALGETPVAKPAGTPKKGDPAFAPVTDDPKLPRVLIIGDSISIGYTVPLQKELVGKANVHRIPVNGGPSSRGVEQIDSWLGDGHWDLIQFNFGLHDLRAMDGRPHQITIEDYESNLRKLVDRLEKTGAVLIWRNTTPVPEGAQSRKTGDEIRYNAVAEKIMKEHGIEIDDHYSFVLPRMNELMLPKNVHFKQEGSAELAKLSAKSIEAHLPAIAVKKGAPASK